MLDIDFTIKTQDNCESIYLVDTTPLFSLAQKGGYGGSNVSKNQITGLEIKLDWGNNVVYELEGGFAVGADFPISWYLLNNVKFGGACENCTSSVVVPHGGAFPSGCVSITYSPTYVVDGEKVIAATKTKKFFIACKESGQLIKLSEKLMQAKMSCRYDFARGEDLTNQAMAEVQLAMSMLMEMRDSKVICDCYGGSLQMIVNRIKELEKLWQ